MSIKLPEPAAREANWASTLRTASWARVAEDLAWQYRKWIALLITAFYLISFNGLWRIGRDSALYLSIARNIARGDGYVYQGEAHRLAYPGLTYLLAGIMEVAGDHAILVADAVMLACALGALYLCYRLFRLMVRPGAAVLATLFVSVNFELYELSYEILTDMPFLLGTMMVLLGVAQTGMLPAPRLSDEAHVPTSRERLAGWFLLAMGLGICAVMRPTFYVLAACVVAACIINVIRKRQSRHALGVASIAILIGGILLLVWMSDPRRNPGEQDIYEQAISHHLTTAIANPEGPLENAIRLFTPVLPVTFFSYSWTPYLDPLIVLLLLGVTGWVLWRWPIAILWIGGTLALQLIVEKPVPRYMIPIVPLLVLAWWQAAARSADYLPRRWANTLALVAYLTLVPGFFRCIGQVWYEQYRRPYIEYVQRGDYMAMYELAEEIRTTTPPDAVLLTPDRMDRVFAYITDRWALAYNEPIPPHFRDHPVYIIHGQRDIVTREHLRRLAYFAGGSTRGVSASEHRRSGILMLKEASWTHPAPEPATP